MLYILAHIAASCFHIFPGLNAPNAATGTAQKEEPQKAWSGEKEWIECPLTHRAKRAAHTVQECAVEEKQASKEKEGFHNAFAYRLLPN